MKQIDDIERTAIELDFSSSGGSTESATAVEVDGLQLVNAAELINWTEAPVQLHVCEKCGIPRCEPGASVAVRRAGTFALLMPDFETMSEGGWERREYRPPDFLKDQGVMALNRTIYDRLQDATQNPRAFEDLRPLSAAEAVRILQFEAPYELLGSFPDEIRLREDLLIASTPVELTEARRLLGFVIETWCKSNHPVSLRRRRDDDRLVSFFTDRLPDFEEWKPLVAPDTGPALHFEGDFVAEL